MGTVFYSNDILTRFDCDINHGCDAANSKMAQNVFQKYFDNP